MAIEVKHAFVSEKVDGLDTSVVQPSDWNDGHTITIAQDKIIGRTGVGTGAAEEITCTAFARTILDDADLATVRATLGMFPSGTKMLFQQTAAPTGWTKDTSHNNKALRIVSGTASSGGSVAFTTAFASKTVSGTTDSTVLTEAHIPNHRHFTFANVAGATGDGIGASNYAARSWTSGAGEPGYSIRGTTTESNVALSSDYGGGTGHTHTFTGTAINLAVQYVDVIVATRD